MLEELKKIDKEFVSIWWKKTAIVGLALFCILVGIGIGAAITQVLQQVHTHPDTLQTHTFSDEEYMRVGIIGYLDSEFSNSKDAFPMPDYDVSLEDQAVDNAIHGKDLWIPVAANTAEEALGTFTSVDGNAYSCGASSFWLATNQRDHPGTKYAVGVYKTSYNQYNVSVVIKRLNPDTKEMNRNGAFVNVEHDPSVFDFTPKCFYGV